MRKTFEQWVDGIIEDDIPGQQIFTMHTQDDEEKMVIWTRSEYNGDREGLDSFTIMAGTTCIGIEVMYHDLDEDVLMCLASQLDPGHTPAQIEGEVGVPWTVEAAEEEV